MSDFKQLIDTDGLDPTEEARLRRMHELLVQAGPPPDLPPALEQAPDEESAEIVQFPMLPRRRWAVAAVAAVAAALLAFGGGYLTGHSKQSAFHTDRVVPMHGQGEALALLRTSKPDSVGNWPMQLEVTGLPEQSDRGAYYELWLTRNGKPVEQCGTFRVHSKTTRVRFTVPYSFKGVDGWVITEQTHGASTPGRVVLST
jgi:hypothetical protein